MARRLLRLVCSRAQVRLQVRLLWRGWIALHGRLRYLHGCCNEEGVDGESEEAEQGAGEGPGENQGVVGLRELVHIVNANQSQASLALFALALCRVTFQYAGSDSFFSKNLLYRPSVPQTQSQKMKKPPKFPVLWEWWKSWAGAQSHTSSSEKTLIGKGGL